MLGGGFKCFGGFMLAVGSSTISWTGLGVLGMAAGTFVAGAGASDMNQGAEEFFLGMSGDSTTQTRNGMSDLFYDGNDTIYHMSTGTAAFAGSLLTPYVNAQMTGKAAVESGANGRTANPQSMMLGDDWNNYFRETYGYENVNWETAFRSPNDIIEMPSIVTRMNPEGLYNYLNESGLAVTPLGQGTNAGISFWEGGGYNVHFRTQYGDSYIQYNPSCKYHGSVPYYKVSSGNAFSYMGSETGTQRFYLNGDIVK